MTYTIAKTKIPLRGTLVAVLAAASLFTGTAGAQQRQMPPALVEVAEASAEMMAPQTYLPGTVVSLNDSRISAEIAGRVVWIASEGTLLAEGDVIAEIDDRNQTLALARNKSQAARLEARIKYLESDLARLQELAANNNIPSSRLEEAESTLAMTREELSQARVAVEQAKIDLARTKVRAPFPGRVVERLAQIGEYSSPGRQIVRLVDTEHLEVSAKAPVTLARVLNDGQQVVIRENDAVADTRIRALVPVGDALSRTMELRVSLPVGSQYVVGAALQVGVPANTPEQVVAVPRDALVLRREGTYVFRVKDDNTAERLMVTTGAATGRVVAVTGGIESGDRVVIRGGERLREGQPVELRGGVNLASGR
ncbi:MULTISPECIES: efflux RND transporter periplasmic adaptor subunit [Kordiimonas]|jgi:RND family efflux transporter MFP subunit|uniref:efflux RND transporter periplasmic adaptor subunit n=1 Tax=Kordiimonas TaxID=288021 RepID=UPI00257A947D|nr:efflux RND transporter periplasmic adaptor subunit [Kordiimonas sp. UBA4487]